VNKVHTKSAVWSSADKAILITYVCWMTVLISIYFILAHRNSYVVRSLVWGSVGLSGIAAIIVGVWRYKPAAWRGWVLLATANLLFISGDMYYKVLHHWLGKTNPFPSFADVLYLVTYPLFAAGIFIFIKHRSLAKSDRGALLDAATFTVGLALLVWVYLIVPNLGVTTTLIVKLTSIAYPLGDVLVWAMLVRLLVIDTRTRSIQLLALGAVGLIASDVIYGISQFHGFWHEGTVADLGWLIFYFSWGAAALHPSMKLLDKPLLNAPVLRTTRLVLLAVAALIAPVVLLIETARDNADQVATTVAIFAATLFVLVILRLFTLMREINLRDAEINVQKQISATINSLDVGLLMTFKDRLDIFYNSALVSILGLDKAVVAANVDESAITLQTIQQKLQQLQEFNLQAAITKCLSDGQPFGVKKATYGSRILSISGTPIMIKQNKTIGTSVLIEDISERKVLERAKKMSSV
jgi:PAS domain-containing protein